MSGTGDCVQRDLSPTSGYTGISARRRYQFWERDLSPTFKRISDRICAASINLVNHKLIVISAYAPTLEVREANPELRELFYNQLDSTVTREYRRRSQQRCMCSFRRFQFFRLHIRAFTGGATYMTTASDILEMCKQEVLDNAEILIL